MKVLGIETSCDETAASVVEKINNDLYLQSNVVASSVDLHAHYGGVVPEIAARSHIEHINPVIDKALKDANVTIEDVDAIAVTQGPGLGGSLMIGVLSARTLAIVNKKPLYAVNHVEAHVYATFINKVSKSLSGYKIPEIEPVFPLLALIVSGGHSQLVLFEDHFKYLVLGQTLDDAVGEAFDKVAKILGLPYPGGPNLEKTAQKGQTKYTLPKAKLANPYDFSFSGLKTATLRLAQKEIGEDFSFPSHKVAEKLSNTKRYNIAASFQVAALGVLVDNLVLASQEFTPKSVVIAGGVAASKALRVIANRKVENIIYPDIKLCTDNAAMVAANAVFQIENNRKPVDVFSLEFLPGLKM